MVNAARDAARYEDAPGKRTKLGKTGASNLPEHFFRIAQWAMNRGGTFTGRELHDKFGICISTSYRYAKAWREVWNGQGPGIRPKKKIAPPASVDTPSPAKVDLARLLEP